MVTDNAANEKKTLQRLGWTRFGCYGHRQNLAVKHKAPLSEDEPDYKTLKCSDVYEWFDDVVLY